MSAGQVKVGAWSSTTVMICSQVVSLPHSSTAVHTLVNVPATPPQPVALPLSLSAKVMVISPLSLQLSEAVG